MLAKRGSLEASSPPDFARSALARVDGAWQEAGGNVREFHTAAARIRVRYLGERAHRELTAAISHLEAGPAQASRTLAFDVWDGATTEARLPRPYWGVDDYGMRGEIAEFEKTGVMARYDLGSETFQLYDHSTGRGLYHVNGVERLPYWEKSFPLRLLLHWGLRDSPWQPVHAGAVGLASGGLLVAGPSGSGKSTTCLGCLNSPLEFLGDDYVLASGGDTPQIHSLYHWAKLERDGLVRLPWLSTKVSNAEELAEKAVVEVAKHYPERLLLQTPLRAIVLPRVNGGGRHSLRPVSHARALRALAPTTLLQLPGSPARTLEKMRAICSKVPAYELLLGASPPEQVPFMLLELLESLDVCA